MSYEIHDKNETRKRKRKERKEEEEEKKEEYTGFLTTHTRRFLWPEPHLLMEFLV